MDDLHLHTDVKPIQKSDPLSAAFGWLRGDTDRHPVVLDGKRPYGIPNRQGLMSRRLDHNAKMHRYTQPVPLVEKDDKLEEILGKFSESLAPYLPYAEKGRLKGCVRPVDLLNRLDDGPDAAIANRYVAPLDRDATMGDALHRFQSEPCDEIPVVDGNGRIEGVLNRRAVIELADAASIGRGRTDRAGENDRLLDEPAVGHMDPGWFEIPPDTSFRAMLPTLGNNEVLYVTEDHRYIGLITAPYLCRTVLQGAGEDDFRARQWFNLPRSSIPEHRQNAWTREEQSR